MTTRTKARFRAWLLAMILLAGATSLRADDTAPTTPATSPTPVVDPVLVGAHYREVITRDQFHELAEPSVNTRIQDWLSQWFRSIGAKFGQFKYASRMPAFESMLMTLLVAFAISVLLHIMMRLTRRRGRMDSEREDEPAGPRTFRPPEAYDQDIRQAIHTGDWHTAWLTSWRQFLSRLEYRHLVDADRTRTNREYLDQLRGQPLPETALALLHHLVDAYDRTIYGRQSIAEADWNQFRTQIDEAALLLHLDEKTKRVPAPGAAA